MPDQLSLLDELKAFADRGRAAQQAMNDLGVGGLARHDHPDTAREAAAQIHPARMRLAVLAFLTERGSEGATDEELIDNVPGTANGIRPRRVELVAAGLVVDSDTKRKNRSKRWAIVWVVTT